MIDFVRFQSMRRNVTIRASIEGLTVFRLTDRGILIDCVSIGSPLGPTIAEYHMSSLETFLLNQNRTSNPLLYVRYMNSHIRHFMNRLQNNSVLKLFTSEQQQNNSFHFLVEQFTITESIIEMSVY